DENSSGCVLAEQAAIEFLLSFEIVPAGVGLLGRNAKSAVFVAVAGSGERKRDGLTHAGGFLEKNLVRAVFSGEKIRGGADAFGSSKNEIAARARSVVKERNHFVLQHKFEIDEEVAAANEIHLRK